MMTRRVVKAPKFTTLHGRRPLWERSWVDPGGTGLFGPGPYLKLRYGGGDLGEDEDDWLETRVRCPYGYPEYDDRLWVRETWRIVPVTDGADFAVEYAAGGEPQLWRDAAGRYEHLYRDLYDRDAAPVVEPAACRWRSPIHLPRDFCRLLLQVESVRVERLQSISEADARAEGVTGAELYGLHYGGGRGRGCLTDDRNPTFDPVRCLDGPRGAFAMLWDALHGRKAGCAWESDCWVWVIEFRKAETVP